jgi:putative ABC transport system permease protein
VQWWVFLVAGIATLVIAFITISLQAIRTAITNPVKNLRAE